MDPQAMMDTRNVGRPGMPTQAPPKDDPEAMGVYDLLALQDEPSPYDPAEVEGAAQIADLVSTALEDDPPDIADDSLLSASDEDIRKVFEYRLRVASDFRAALEPEWLKSRADYSQQLEGAADRWQTKVALPYTRSQIDAWVPLCASAILDTGGALWAMKAIGQQNDKPAQTIEAYLDNAARQKAEMPRKLRDGLFYAGLFGTGIWRPNWKYRKIRRRVIEGTYLSRGEGVDPETGMPEEPIFLGPRKVLRDIVAADHPDLVHVFPWDFFPCPWTKDGKIPWAIEAIELSQDEWLDAAKAGAFGPEAEANLRAWFATNPDTVKAAGLCGSISSRIQEFTRVGKPDPYASYSAVEEVKDPKYRPFRCYLMSTDEYRVLIAGDGSYKVLGKCEDPFLFDEVPYGTFNAIREPGCVWGTGFGQVLRPIQRYINFIFNHAADTAMLRRNAPLMVPEAGSDRLGAQTNLRPGAWLKVRDPLRVKALEIPEVMREMMMLKGDLMEHGDRATGISDLLRGFSVEDATTATESTILQTRARQRQSGHIAGLRDLMGKLGRFFVKLCQQYLTTEQSVQVAGEAGLEWRVFKPEEILGEWDVVPLVSFRGSNIGQQRNDWAAQMAVFSDPLYAAFVNPVEVVKESLRLNEIDRPERFIRIPVAPHSPRAERMMLNDGQQVRPSPEEDFEAHLAQHVADLNELEMNPIANPLAIQATRQHIEATMQLEAEVGLQMALAAASMGGQADTGGGGPSAGGQANRERPPGSARPQRPGMGKGEVSRGATAAGRSAGAAGPPGRAPGPLAAARRDVA